MDRKHLGTYIVGLLCLFVSACLVFQAIKPPFDPVVASILMGVSGALGIVMSLLHTRIVRAFLLVALALFVLGALACFVIPNWVDGGSGQDAVTLAGTISGMALGALGLLFLLAAAIVAAFGRN